MHTDQINVQKQNFSRLFEIQDPLEVESLSRHYFFLSVTFGGVFTKRTVVEICVKKWGDNGPFRKSFCLKK